MITSIRTIEEYQEALSSLRKLMSYLETTDTRATLAWIYTQHEDSDAAYQQRYNPFPGKTYVDAMNHGIDTFSNDALYDELGLLADLLGIRIFDQRDKELFDDSKNISNFINSWENHIHYKETK